MPAVLEKTAALNFPRRILRTIFFLSLLAAGEVFAQRPLGTDVFNYQPSINWTPVKNAGVEFAWSKATEGTLTPVPRFSPKSPAQRTWAYTLVHIISPGQVRIQTSPGSIAPIARQIIFGA